MLDKTELLATISNLCLFKGVIGHFEIPFLEAKVLASQNDPSPIP
jgi:hypothetical protein